MVTNEILELNIELLSEVRDYARKNQISTEDAFTNIFTSYIVESGEPLLADCNIINFKKTSEKIKVNGFCIDEFFQSITLVISDFTNKEAVEKIGKTDINSLVKLASKFFKLCKTEFFLDTEESGNGYKIYEAISAHFDNIQKVYVVLLTNRISANYIPEDQNIGNIIIKYDVWDIERVCQCIYQKRIHKDTVIQFKDKYKYNLKMIKAEPENDIYDCYIGVIPGYYLASIYRDEGQKLIEKNVRSFLQATGKINKGIRDTIKNEPEMFMAYNNGISTIAEDIEIDKEESNDKIITINSLTNWQIVNGGQTTASIYNALQSGLSLDTVNVQMKLTVIKDIQKSTEIISNISRYANSQNKINMSDFSANEDYHIEMERLSRKIFVPVEKGKATNRWFYERARGQYLVELNRQLTSSMKRQFKEMNPKKQCISKTVAAKCQMAWMKYPYIVSKGLETNFVVFSEMVKKNQISKPSEESYISMIAHVILFQECDKIVANLKFGGYKAQVNYYTIAALSEFYSNEVDESEIWRNQEISVELSDRIEKLAYKVWNHFMNPEVQGINVTQWCKKEDCWNLLKKRLEIEQK